MYIAHPYFDVSIVTWYVVAIRHAIYYVIYVIILKMEVIYVIFF